MHIPDGILSAHVAIGTAGLSLGALLIASSQAWQQWSGRLIPVAGVTSAFVFAAQMVNFPIPGGTSGHLLGAALLAAILGSPAAILSMATVLLVQCLLFQDGGLTALGANILNMAVIGVLTSSLTMRIAMAPLAIRPVVYFLAGWFSIVASAAACSLELFLSGVWKSGPAILTMVGVHAVIGLVEGFLTAAILGFIERVQPEILLEGKIRRLTDPELRRTFVWGLFFISVGIVVLLAPFASSLPDGLEWILEHTGLSAMIREASGPLTDYKLPWANLPSWLQTIVAGLLGIGVILALWLIVGGLLRFWKPSKTPINRTHERKSHR